jgi:hypothetical protein
MNVKRLLAERAQDIFSVTHDPLLHFSIIPISPREDDPTFIFLALSKRGRFPCIVPIPGASLMRASIAILLLTISKLAMAGALEDANSAYDKGDFGLARNLYSERLARGHVSPLRNAGQPAARRHPAAPRHALEKPLKVHEIMKRANIANQEACQSLLLKMRDEGLVKFDIHKGQWLIA